MKPVFLEGENIFLSYLSPDDNFENYIKWVNDQDTTTYMGVGKFPSTEENLKEYVNSYNRSNVGILFGIFLKESSAHIGNITLHQIDYCNRFGEIGIMIGDKNSRGKGYATQAIRLVVEHGFFRVNLRKLCAGVVKENEGSKKAFEKVGFKVEGMLREHFYLNGKYLDCYRMGLLRSEFKGE